MARQSSEALTLAEFAKLKGFTVDELAIFGVREGFDRIEVPYYDENNVVYSRMRTRAGDRGFAWTPGDEELIPYGVWVPIPPTRGMVFVVEGESDCWALWLAGIPALGVPGATATSVLHARYFRDVDKVGVIQEPGEAGSRFPFRVAQRLSDTGYTGAVFAITLGKYKDARDAFIANRDTFKFRLEDAWRARKPVAIQAPVAPAWPKLQTFAEACAEPRVAPEWLVDGTLPTGGIALLVAKAKVGKSNFARNLAYSVLTGTPFLDREVRKGPVLWLALEEDKHFLVDEFQALGVTDAMPLYLCAERAPQDAMAWLEDALKTIRPALVVVDTWYHLTRVKDVNDYVAVKTANEPLVRMAHEHGCAMLWAHHAGKTQRREDAALGSSAFTADCFSFYAITRDSRGVRTLWSMQRQGDPFEDDLLDYDPDTRRVTLGGSRLAVATVEAARRMVQILADCGPLDAAELARRLKTRKQVFYAVLRQKTSVGDVVAVGGSGKAREPYIYDLAPKLRENITSSATSASSGGSASSASSNDREPGSQSSAPVVRELYPRCRRCDLLLNPRTKHLDGLCSACERETN